jgi:Domain of unknown function (DUF6046)
MNHYDLKKIYRQSFGIEPPDDYQVEKGLKASETSKLGQRFHDNDVLGHTNFLPVYLNEIVLPFATIEITTKKTIVATPMPEQNGTVKEIIGRDDYIINVRGLIVSDDNRFPEFYFLDFEEMFTKNQTYTLRNVLTDYLLKGSHQVVIAEMRFPRVLAIENVRPYEFVLWSDDITTLEIPVYV